MEGEDGVVLVVFAGEQGLQPGSVHPLLQIGVAGDQFLQHGVVVLLDGHIAKHQQILPLGTHLFIGIDLVLQLMDLLGNLLGFLRIVPEPVGFRHGVEPIQFLLGSLQSQGLPQCFQLRTQIPQLYLIFIKLNFCHILNHFRYKISTILRIIQEISSAVKAPQAVNSLRGVGGQRSETAYSSSPKIISSMSAP